MSGQLDVYMDLPYVLVVLSNYDPPAAQQVAHRVREMVVEVSR